MDFWSSNIWSPLGVMVITGSGLEIAEINFADPNAKFGKFSRDSRQYAKQILKLRQKLDTVPMISNCDNRDEQGIQDLVGEARQQLADYFLGELRNFALPLVISNSPTRGFFLFLIKELFKNLSLELPDIIA